MKKSRKESELSFKKISEEIEKLRNLHLLQEIRSDLDQWVKKHSFSSSSSEEHIEPLLSDLEKLFTESALTKIIDH